MILWLCGGGVVAIGLVIVLIVVLGGGKVSKANFEKLKAGMSEDQVVAILGSPDTNLDAGKILGDLKVNGNRFNLGGMMPKTLMWQSGDDFIQAVFQGDKLQMWQGKFGTEMVIGNGGGRINMPNFKMPNIPRFKF